VEHGKLTFVFLYYCGLRLNKVQEIKIIDVKNLLKNEMIKLKYLNH